MTFLECSWLDKHGSDQGVFLSAAYKGNRTYTVDGNDITTLKEKLSSGHFKDFKYGVYATKYGLAGICHICTTVNPGPQIGI